MRIITLFRIPLTFFLLGMVIKLVGTAFKISHYPGGTEILYTGLLFQAIALVHALIILLISTSKKRTQ